MDSLQSLRFNTQYGDLNAAGSYFAMMTILAAYHAGVRTVSERLFAAALPLLGCALWISGSRVALVSAFLCTLLVVLGRDYGPVIGRLRSRVNLTAAAGIVLLLFGLMIFLLPVTRHGTFAYSVSTRLELLKTGLRMVADRPILGVGTAQFYALFPRYVSPELKRTFETALGHPVPRENAHNQFLQVLAEMGVAGLAFFLLLLVSGSRRGDRAVPWRTAGLAALAGFLLTSMAGHPLLTPAVACAFWIMLGLVAAGSAPVHDATRRALARGVAVVVILLVVTVPWRWAVERREADLEGVSLGLSGWQWDEAGVRFRSAAQRATVFVSSASPYVTIPLRSADAASRRVQIFLDGRLAASIDASPDRWVDVRLPLSRGSRSPSYRRVDLVVTDGAVPAGPQEPRGLMVGRVIEP